MCGYISNISDIDIDLVSVPLSIVSTRTALQHPYYSTGNIIGCIIAATVVGVGKSKSQRFYSNSSIRIRIGALNMTPLSCLILITRSNMQQKDKLTI
jgi:hypothetical protein